MRDPRSDVLVRRALRPRVAAPALLLLFACTQYSFERVVPEKLKQAKVVVPAAKPRPADILFVVDNSGSMEDKQDNIARNFDAFIDEIAGAGDYRIAIVTGDTSPSMDGFEQTGNYVLSYKSTEPYTLTGFSRRSCTLVTEATSGAHVKHGCFRGGGRKSDWVITSDMPREQQIELFRQNVHVGTCTGGEEALNGMLLALENTRPGRCNEGFLRDDANLVIVILTDEDDQDPGRRDVMGYYVQQIKQYKPISEIRVAVIAAADKDGNPANCSINSQGQPDTCGSQCSRPPPAGSHQACTTGRSCPTGEFCTTTDHPGSPLNVCENADLEAWSYCHWCPYYKAPDCCTGLQAARYIGFARAMELEITRADPSITASGCRPAEKTRAACIVDSICQAEFNKTLIRIARDLVLTDTYTLDPPPVYGPGVVVKVNGKTLKYGEDYEITGPTLRFKGASSPRSTDRVEIYYIIES